MQLLTTRAMLAVVFRDTPEDQRPKEQTVRKARCTGHGLFANLRYVKVGRRCYYRSDDVAAWLAALPSYRTTSEMECV